LTPKRHAIGDGVLFLYRPRQSWMPYTLPRDRTQQAAYNRRLQEQFESTRRVRPVPRVNAADASPGDTVGALEKLVQLRSAGVVDDAEFAVVKAKILGTDTA
jgi:hypothetical protein